MSMLTWKQRPSSANACHSPAAADEAADLASAARTFADKAFSRPLPLRACCRAAELLACCDENPRDDMRFEPRSWPISPLAFRLRGGNSSLDGWPCDVWPKEAWLPKRNDP